MREQINQKQRTTRCTTASINLYPVDNPGGAIEGEVSNIHSRPTIRGFFRLPSDIRDKESSCVGMRGVSVCLSLELRGLGSWTASSSEDPKVSNKKLSCKRKHEIAGHITINNKYRQVSTFIVIVASEGILHSSIFSLRHYSDSKVQSGHRFPVTH